MAIRRQHGKVSSIAKLAELAGKSIEARRQAQRREESIARAQEMQRQEQLANQARQAQFDIQVANINAKKEAQVMSIGWENQKLLMNSQRKFELEQLKQSALVQRELAKTIKKMDEYDLAKSKLQELLANEDINEEQYKQALAKTDMKFLGYEGTIPQAKTVDPIDNILKLNRALASYTPEQPDKWYTWGGKPAKIKKRDATPEEIERMEALRTGNIPGVATPQTIIPPEIAKTPADIEKYKELINRGWTPDAIKTALGK